MNEKIETLYELCETLDRELQEANEKIRKAGGKLNAGDVDYIDKLTHSLKSVKTTIAMMEAEDEGGYSNRDGSSMRGGRNYNGMSYEGGMSRARGRQNARRDSMGRYSREGGYSYAEDMEATKDEIRELAMKMPDEHRRKIERALEDLR